MNKVLKILLISSVTFSLFSGPDERLLYAAENGDLAGVKAAIIAGADVNATNVYGNTALVEATENRHTNVVRLLLDRGADVNAIGYNGDTALIRAVVRRSLDIVRLLLDRGADTNAATNTLGSTALILAAENGRIDIVKLLLDRGANDGDTALRTAAASGHTDIVKLLLNRGANIDNADSGGNTALMQAAKRGYPDTVRLLLNMGANFDQVNQRENTALNYAQMRGHTEIVKILEEPLKVKQLVDNAIQDDSSAYQELMEKLKDLKINSYEFNLILNHLINRIKDVGVNRSSRKLLIDLAYHIAINLGSAVVSLLPEDILVPMLIKNFLPNTDLEYEFDMMHLDEHNRPVKKNLLEIVYAFYKKIGKLEEKVTKIKEKKRSK